MPRFTANALAALLTILLGVWSPAFAQDARSGAGSECQCGGRTAPHRANDREPGPQTPWPGSEPSGSAALWDIPIQEIEIEVDYGHGIVLSGTTQYIEEMADLLDRLALLPTGEEILEALGETGYTTTISALASGDGPNARPSDPASATFLVTAEGEEVPGPGSDAIVHMDPDSTIPRTSPEIVLGHELLHALHYHQGERLNERQTEGPNANTKFEELRTIGTDGYDDEELSENELREDWNELYPDDPVAPERNGHGGEDFGPSRTAPGSLAEATLSQAKPGVKESQPQQPRAVQPTVPPEVQPTLPPEVEPVTIQPDPSAAASAHDAEGASQILRRRLGGR